MTAGTQSEGLVMPTVLIAPGPMRRRPGAFREVLDAAGFATVEPPGEEMLAEDELRAILPDCDAMIAGGESITGPIMDVSPRLRAIARTGVGYDAVDVAAATARGIAVTITPGTNHDSVAEQAFALLLAMTRRIAVNDRIVRAGGWERTLADPVRGKVMGLVGLGRIGRAMVPRARAFGLGVLAFDPDARADAEFDGVWNLRRASTLEELLAGSDVVSLHLPLGPSTYRLFDARLFASMKPGAYFLNTSRGGLVDESALLAALESGRLAGAGLDVLDPEPPDPASPLLQHPAVVVSPHLGGIDTKSMADMAELAARCVVDLAADRWPGPCAVNAELGRGWCWSR